MISYMCMTSIQLLLMVQEVHSSSLCQAFLDNAGASPSQWALVDHDSIVHFSKSVLGSLPSCLFVLVVYWCILLGRETSPCGVIASF